MPVTAPRTLASVNSSAITACRPEVPNRIRVVTVGRSPIGFCFPDSLALHIMDPGRARGLIGSSMADGLKRRARPTQTRGTRFYMTNKRIVLTTASSLEDSERIARHLVEQRLAACVNIVPKIASVYRWEDKVEEAQEHLLVIKTTEAAFARLREAIRQLHSYQVPECIALAVEEGSLPYLQWIDDSVDRF